jgi:hypothetical protein
MAPGYGPPRPRSQRWVWGALGIGAVVVAGSCGTCLVAGGALLEEEVCAELGRQPAVVDRLGPELDCELAWIASMDDERMDYFHYRVTGARGSGVAVLHTEATGPGAVEELVAGELRIGGERIELAPR